MNILVAEDERITRRSLQRQLEGWGHHVVAAEDGLAAWEQFQNGQFDIVVTENLYGDILSDLCAGLVGGLGVAPGANMGDEIALFEPTHGSAPKYKGMNKMNPFAMMLSGVMMLRYLGEMDAAENMESSIATVIEEGIDVTYDLKPKADDPSAVSTTRMAEAIIEKMKG